MKNYILYYHVLVPRYLGGHTENCLEVPTNGLQMPQFKDRHLMREPNTYHFSHLERVDSKDSFRTQRKGW